MNDHQAAAVDSTTLSMTTRPIPVIRSLVAGVLMGLANLVPGVSGGTMILVAGLYDDFITAVANVSRFRFARRDLALLALIGGAAAVSIVGLAGTLSRAVTLHQGAMYALFVGFTLGGAPMLVKMIGRFSPASIVGVLIGLAIMVAVFLSDTEKPDQEAIRTAVASGQFVITPNYDRDVVAGVVGMSAMVLPGVSGAYMLLVLDRYETVLASISVAKRWALSFGEKGDIATAMKVIIPVAIGSVLSLVLFTGFLKWALHRFQQPSLGILLGILLGSVIGIWPFRESTTAAHFATGIALMAAGFVFTALLARYSTR